jgi:opacity protein-like surface antigen
MPEMQGAENMKRFALASLLSVCALSAALAQDTCSNKAVGKDGKPLAGAALKSFMAKCSKDACEPKAIDSNGKRLAGAAKASFMKKCQSEA